MFFYLVEPIGFEPPTIGLWARPKTKYYITMWVLLSSRPSPRQFPGWDWESGWESWCGSI